MVQFCIFELVPVVHLTPRITRLQVAELEYLDGKISCDRNKPTYVTLKPPKN